MARAPKKTIWRGELRKKLPISSGIMKPINPRSLICFWKESSMWNWKSQRSSRAISRS